MEVHDIEIILIDITFYLQHLKAARSISCFIKNKKNKKSSVAVKGIFCLDISRTHGIPAIIKCSRPLHCYLI